jgi:hypothetical protein
VFQLILVFNCSHFFLASFFFLGDFLAFFIPPFVSWEFTLCLYYISCCINYWCWTALWLLLNGSAIILTVKGRSDFVICHTLCFHLLLPWRVFLNVGHLQLHPALLDSPCAIKYLPSWSSFISISSFQLLIHFPYTFVEFDAKFVGHNFAQYSCVDFYDTFNKHTVVYFMITWHTLNGSSLTLFRGMGNITSFKLDSRFDVQCFDRILSGRSHDFCDRPHA